MQVRNQPGVHTLWIYYHSCFIYWFVYSSFFNKVWDPCRSQWIIKSTLPSITLFWHEASDLWKSTFSSFPGQLIDNFMKCRDLAGSSKLAWGSIRGREWAWYGFLTGRKWAERISWATAGLWLANVKGDGIPGLEKLITPVRLWTYGSFRALADLSKVNRVTVGALSNFSGGFQRPACCVNYAPC